MCKKVFPLVVLALMISGCVPTKPSDLKKDSAAHYKFEVDEPLSLVTNKVYNRLDQCHVKPITSVGKKLEVVDKQSLGQSEVYYRSIGSGGIYIIGVLMTAESQDKTSVRVAYHGPWKNAATAVQRWIKDDYVECYTHAFSDSPKKGLNGFKSLNFEVNKNSKNSFITVSNGLTQCLDGRDSMGKAAYLVDSIYQEDKRMGHVTVGYHGFSFEYKMKVSISQANDSKTKVIVRYGEGFAPHALQIEEWLNSESRVCEI